jgi:hypothetical protein
MKDISHLILSLELNAGNLHCATNMPRIGVLPEEACFNGSAHGFVEALLSPLK